MRSSALFVLLAAGPSAGAQESAEPVDFYGRIQPILAVHCHRCHGPETAKSKLRLDMREHARKAISSGELLRRVGAVDDDRMPPEGARLTAKEVDLLRRWIEAGSPWPARDDYWAFQPPRDLPPPPGAAANPIDRFLDARLLKEGIVAVGPADRRTLLRRAFADLAGVPPTPEESDVFLSDPADDAWEKLVDRLLADPRYGERWGRHWLDLARYGESDGYEDDKIRPHAWRYRDWVIGSLNADAPYDRFVQEQIAGDELFPGGAGALVATGFARLGAWDGMSKEPRQQRQDFLNDATDVAGSVLLGMTVGCARCHDHKFDRITQADYYGFQAFFAGVQREVRALPGEVADPAPVAGAFRRLREELGGLRGERETLLREARDIATGLRRCDVGPDGTVKVTDEDVAKIADRLRKGRKTELDAAIRERELAERFVRPEAETAAETSPGAPKTFLLRRGQLSTPGQEIPPAFVEAMVPPGRAAADIVAPPGGRTSGRRAALARWLTSPGHPLTGRVIVNRLWQHHFGRGIVATPSDFGRNGAAPSHPELLDWLALELPRRGWSLKAMHRLMMTSAAYRRGASHEARAAERDPDNRLIWRRDRLRLEAEALRDSILATAGRLSASRGGPGVYAPIPKEVNVMLPNNDKELSWGTSTDEEGRRRTIYLFQRRSLTFPLVEVFDGADMKQTCAQRAQTTVAPQALALFNGDFCRGEARHFAARVEREAGDDAGRRVDRAFRLALIREPSTREREASRAFLSRQAALRKSEGAALADFCHVLLNTNEFLYVD